MGDAFRTAAFPLNENDGAKKERHTSAALFDFSPILLKLLHSRLIPC